MKNLLLDLMNNGVIVWEVSKTSPPAFSCANMSTMISTCTSIRSTRSTSWMKLINLMTKIIDQHRKILNFAPIQQLVEVLKVVPSH